MRRATNGQRHQARLMFPAHRQPDLPADLGFCDLRLPEASIDAVPSVSWLCAALSSTGTTGSATAGGSSSGGAVIPGARHLVLSGVGEPTWSGLWHNYADRILMKQHYPGDEDSQAHFEFVLPAFREERYLRVDRRPVYYVSGEPPRREGVRGLWQTCWRAGLVLEGSTPWRIERAAGSGLDPGPDTAGAAALGQVVERVGRGQPPGARPAAWSRLART